jgi:hypothetical protein
MIKKICTVLMLLYSLWLMFFYRYHFIDGANLLFHEAGHFVFSGFGLVVHFLGGSIGQLIFPAVCIASFVKRRQFFEASVCGVWFGENLINIGWYMSDAKTMAIPLVGGGIHDWNWLFSKAGILEHCRAVSTFVHILAAGILLYSVFIMYRSSFLLPETEDL